MYNKLKYVGIQALILLLTLLPITVNSQQIVVHIGSMHTHKMYNINDERDRLNNYNVGIGYAFPTHTVVGMYYNSYYRPTFYLVQELMYNDYIGIVGGVATGYKLATNRTLSPTVAILVKMPITDAATINLAVMPRIRQMAGVAHLTLSINY